MTTALPIDGRINELYRRLSDEDLVTHQGMLYKEMQVRFGDDLDAVDRWTR